MAREFLLGLSLSISVLGCLDISSDRAVLLQEKQPEHLAPPIQEDIWIIPSKEKIAEPVWGIKNGIAIGLWPTRGPRGLIRVYAPYLGHKPQRVVNFIAVEPIVDEKRGFSELEKSDFDNIQGKAMWSGNEIEEDSKPCNPWNPVSGKKSKVGHVKTLSLYL